MRTGRPFAALCLSLLAGCATVPPPHPGIGAALSWRQVPGWPDADITAAWPALLAECGPAKPVALLQAVCAKATTLVSPDAATLSAFFERWFAPHEIVNATGGHQGLLTAYFEPVVPGRLHRSPGFTAPLYAKPPGLLHIELGAVDPALAAMRLRGRLRQGRVVPYYTRADIVTRHALAGHELVWLKDPLTAFLVEVQGSAVISFPDGSRRAVRYADQNGYPYRPLLSCFAALHLPAPQPFDLPALRAWVATHEAETPALLACNPSFVFFRFGSADHPSTGSLGVSLTAGRSVAVDPRYIPLGTALWLSGAPNPPVSRLVFAQDTGGAIRGPVRIDLFLGRGAKAGEVAGVTKAPIRLWALIPRVAPGH